MSHKHEGPRQKRQFDPHAVQIMVKTVRDMALFILGAGGFIHELLRTGAERPQILILTAAMVGLPVIIRGDEKRQEVKSNVEKQTGDNHGSN